MTILSDSRTADSSLNSEEPAGVSARLHIAGWRVDRNTNRVSRGEESIRLEPKVIELLAYLAGRPGELVSREELESAVWAGTIVGYDAIAGAVQKIRKAFKDDPRSPHVIETISKRGYRLIATVDYDRGESPPLDSQEPESPLPARVRKWPFWRVGVAVPLILVLTGVAVWMGLSNQRQEMQPVPRSALKALSGTGVAILPFENLNADPTQEYFSNGITEDLITDLAKVPGLMVIASNSTFTYRNSAETDQNIGSKLGARYLLRGSVQRWNDRLRINTRLIDTQSGASVWAERFDRQIKDLFVLQDEIADKIVTSLKVSLAPSAGRSLQHRVATNIDAYDAFLRAQYQYGRRFKEANELARALYQHAIDLDPKLARAYGGLALTHFRDAIEGYTDSPETSIQVAADFAQRAIALDPELPHVHFVKGQIEMFRKNYTAAIEAIKTALALLPSFADAYATLGWMLHFSGHHDDALESVEIATRLNPVIPGSYYVVLGGLHYSMRHYPEAVNTLEKGREINLENYRLRLWLAAAYAQAGRLNDATWEVAELVAIDPEMSLARLAQMFPFLDATHLDHLIEGLRKAGMRL